MLHQRHHRPPRQGVVIALAPTLVEEVLQQIRRQLGNREPLPGHPAAHVRQHPQLPVSHLHGVTLRGQLVPEPIHVASKRTRHADPASLVHRRLLAGTIPVTEASTRAADYAAAAATHQRGGDYHDRPPTTRGT